MKLYFAPLEGITGYLYRNIYHEFFGEGIDKYFAPFIVPVQAGSGKSRMIRDILPENNEGIFLVPQILSNNAENFIALSEQIAGLGYQEVNLNLGCPYGTVVAKGRGSGMLSDPAALERFLDTVFESLNGKIEISVKTRIGLDSENEWEDLLSVYNRYPMKELIIHPRIQKDFYKNYPRMEAFDLALRESKNPICYNGDIFTKKDYLSFLEKYPNSDRVMIGRGFLTNPGLLWEIRDGKRMPKETFRGFHDRLYSEYRSLMGEDKNTLFKMKEFWNYARYLFDEQACSKYIKKIKKSKNGGEYEAAVKGLFRDCDIREDAGFEG
ncbi:MAG: tRNA dihydrouridine synthase [Suilimivivens sp.]